MGEGLMAPAAAVQPGGGAEAAGVGGQQDGGQEPRPPVWADSRTVGRATGWNPMTASTGVMMARLHRPAAAKLWMQRTFLGSVGKGQASFLVKHG